MFPKNKVMKAKAYTNQSLTNHFVKIINIWMDKNVHGFIVYFWVTTRIQALLDCDGIFYEGIGQTHSFYNRLLCKGDIVICI